MPGRAGQYYAGTGAVDSDAVLSYAIEGSVKMRSIVWLMGLFVIGLLAIALTAQDVVYQCPMDPDIRSNKEGFCSRCGMKLRSGIPEPIEFPVDLKVLPRAVRPGEKAQLEFSVHDPQNDRQIE